jgi:hypothetical protein
MRNVVRSNDNLTPQAVKAPEELLGADLLYAYRAMLQPGRGLIGNNVLHDRSGFNDDDD